jgi:hypothetical protein
MAELTDSSWLSFSCSKASFASPGEVTRPTWLPDGGPGVGGLDGAWGDSDVTRAGGEGARARDEIHDESLASAPKLGERHGHLNISFDTGSG